MGSVLGTSAPLRGRRFRRIGNVLILPSTSSTNSLGRRVAERMLADDTDLPPTVFATWHQTSGRGRAGRSWKALPGSLALSTLVPWPEPAQRVKLPLSFGIAFARALSRQFEIELRLKWPNDLLFSKKKLGGILVEPCVNSDGLGYAIIGTGINVLTSREDLDAAGLLEASSLACAAPDIGRMESEDALVKVLDAIDEALSSFPDDLPSAFQTVSAHQPGDLLTVNEASRRIEGRFEGVTAEGFLRLSTARGEEEILSGDVLTY